jgi:hypothetical protein
MLFRAQEHVREFDVPHAMVQLEQSLEPVVEWFNGLPAPRVEPFSFVTLEELQSREAPPVMFIPRDRRRTSSSPLCAAAICGTQELSLFVPACFIPLDALADFVAVVAGISHHMVGFFGQVADLFGRCLRLFRAGRIDGRQQR